MNEVSGLKDNQEWWGVWTTGEGDTLPFPAFASCGDEGPMLPNLNLEGETSRFFNVRNHSVWCSYFA